MSIVPDPAAGADPGDLEVFRRRVFTEVLGPRKRTLFGLMDAVTGAGEACRCPAHVSLPGPAGHAAAYRALREGQVDPAAALATACAVAARRDLPRVYAVDTTAVPRPNAPTSPDRQPQHTPGGTRTSSRIVTGWRYQQIVRLTLTPDSWVLPVLLDRVASEEDLVEVTAAQIAQVCAADGATPAAPSLFVLDSGYPAARITFLLRTRGVPAAVLVRLSTSQVMWTRPELVTAHPLGGRPRRHGLRLSLRAPDLPPDTSVSAPLPLYGQVTVGCWHRMHPKIDGATRGFETIRPAPVVEGTILHATVQHLRPSRRAGDLVLWYSGTRTDLLGLVVTYLARFDIEHFFRYLKTTAGIGCFHPQQPGAYTTWLRLHALAYTQLLLARDTISHRRLPWEPTCQPVLTPGQVRRQVSPTLANAWHPPGPPKPGHPGPGRPAGRRRRRRKRHKVVRTAALHKGK